MHGLRHRYAQSRYKTLTAVHTHTPGWECPRRGGKQYDEMTEEEKKIDKKVRQAISFELGHKRLEILKIYCG